MLVLSRKQGESVRIDEEIQVTVVSVGRGRVKLGIVAPGHVPIMRQELVGCGRTASATHEDAWPQTAVGETLTSSP